MLKLVLDAYPEAIRHTNRRGHLPLHHAATKRSPEFCRMLVELYPESVRVAASGGLPLHYACSHNTLPTVEYCYKLYPDAVNHAATKGYYPIHWAVTEEMPKSDKTASIDVVKFLLQLPGVKEQKFEGKSLLYFACNQNYKSSTIEAGIQIIKGIYDADPKAIEDDNITASVHRWREEI